MCEGIDIKTAPSHTFLKTDQNQNTRSLWITQLRGEVMCDVGIYKGFWGGWEVAETWPQGPGRAWLRVAKHGGVSRLQSCNSLTRSRRLLRIMLWRKPHKHTDQICIAGFDCFRRGMGSIKKRVLMGLSWIKHVIKGRFVALSFTFFPNRATKTPATAPCPCRGFESPEAKGAVYAVTCPPVSFYLVFTSKTQSCLLTSSTKETLIRGAEYAWRAARCCAALCSSLMCSQALTVSAPRRWTAPRVTGSAAARSPESRSDGAWRALTGRAPRRSPFICNPIITPEVATESGFLFLPTPLMTSRPYKQHGALLWCPGKWGKKRDPRGKEEEEECSWHWHSWINRCHAPCK